MSLSEIWRLSPDQLKDKHILQIISFSGSGKLRDEQTVEELQEYFACVPSLDLARYVNETLYGLFDGNRIVLPHLVNEVGRRLGFHVSFETSSKHTIWRMNDGRTIVIVVEGNSMKQTNLDDLAVCWEQLFHKKQFKGLYSSILIITGSGKVELLQKQVRSSGYAGEISFISIDSLLILLRLKEELGDPNVLTRMIEIMFPQNYTNLDDIIDLFLLVARDMPPAVPMAGFVSEEKDDAPALKEKGKQKPIFVDFRELCMERVKKYLKINIVKQSRVIYAALDNSVKIVCLIAAESKALSKHPYFWFGFRPKQQKALEKTEEAFLVLGCGSEELILIIPYDHFKQWLAGMSVSVEGEIVKHWHVVVSKEQGNLILRLKGGLQSVDLSQYILPS